MTAREQLEAEAEELYPITKSLDVDHTAIVIAQRSAHARAKTITADELRRAKAEAWRELVVRLAYFEGLDLNEYPNPYRDEDTDEHP